MIGRQTPQRHQAEFDIKRSPGCAVEQVRPLQSSIAEIDDPVHPRTQRRPPQRLVSLAGDAGKPAVTAEYRDQNGNDDLPTDPGADRHYVQPENRFRAGDVQHQLSVRAAHYAAKARSAMRFGRASTWAQPWVLARPWGSTATGI